MGNAQASHADHHRRHSGGRGGQGGIILPNDKAPGFGNRETSPYEPVSITAVTKLCLSSKKKIKLIRCMYFSFLIRLDQLMYSHHSKQVQLE